MSTTFSANSGSFDSLKERVRCGLSPCSFHTRCTVVCPTPSSAASMRALQCVAFVGFSLAVRVTISSRTALLIRFLPARGPLPLSFSSRATPPSMYAFCQRHTVGLETRVSHMIALVPIPHPDSSTILARLAIFCGVLPSATSRSSVVRSLSPTYRHASMSLMPSTYTDLRLLQRRGDLGLRADRYRGHTAQNPPLPSRKAALG